MAAAPNVIAIHDDDIIDKASLGRIVFWSLAGYVVLDSLTAALLAEGSTAIPPEEVTAKVALHRAVETVAGTLKGHEALMRKRGDWAIVRKPTEKMADGGGKEIAYPIVATAKIDNGALVVETTEGPDLRAQLEATFAASKQVLAPADIGHWLCAKLRALDAVSLRDSGGFYFLPADRCEKWDKLVAGVRKASSHALHAIPAMRTQDAVDAILAAVTTETLAECEAIAKDIAVSGLGKRALETREASLAGSLEKLGRYESLLGARLDGLRDAIDKATASVAVAKMALAAED
jgi:hypothetical protein